eukprot:gnl/MRDRNA2_/MRDRNA2_93898_c0_seq1.p1 gnl/MRDRNA2_/MRDRNA2_93898_c0~~gnl/MRDRNA2_/MRDRNA2_93898_c0_seq1.p1  ORF type:complete len:426 (-),score=50.43 gnl/MRDRNA2_/MRDRNA2_93898_c0_seq1:86-1363(-)
MSSGRQRKRTSLNEGPSDTYFQDNNLPPPTSPPRPEPSQASNAPGFAPPTMVTMPPESSQEGGSQIPTQRLSPIEGDVWQGVDVSVGDLVGQSPRRSTDLKSNPSRSRDNLETANNSKQFSQELYVQSVRDSSRFRPESRQRAQNVYGFRPDAAQGHQESRKRGERPKIPRRAPRWWLSSVAAIRAVVFDAPDAKSLQLSEPMDSSVFELLVRSEQSQTSAGATFFCVQGLLAGASLIAMALLLEYQSSPSDMAEPIIVIEPALGRLTMACSEVSVVASFLRFHKARQARMSLDFLDRYSMDDSDARQRAASLVGINLLALAVSVALLVCCLLSGRYDAWLLYGPWDETTGRPVDAEVGKVLTEDEAASRHWLLLFVRSVLGFVAVFLALVDTQAQLAFVSPVVSVPLAPPQSGATQELRNTASA